MNLTYLIPEVPLINLRARRLQEPHRRRGWAIESSALEALDDSGDNDNSHYSHGKAPTHDHPLPSLSVSETPTKPSKPSLQTLPDEILLKILRATDHRSRDRQEHLLNVALVNRRFPNLAHEVLIDSPSVNFSHFDKLVVAYKRYGRFRGVECLPRVKALEIHASKDAIQCDEENDRMEPFCMYMERAVPVVYMHTPGRWPAHAFK